ncbi:hypothetical protein OZX67_03245 [Bifidobacterium sp. ESL0728]|uniref:hypothetical protein n=1 Tax=Bifidobacterium sp. ESL0728 TaxID=2983220 RepID=UPI0023F85ECE|nr:hypothetical protein [Bifidobacterium sp. ESL0728]WEV59573.1 hypothetical protein OZX67_03245 [Bifidobacterium sp. ESL0728]
MGPTPVTPTPLADTPDKPKSKKTEKHPINDGGAAYQSVRSAAVGFEENIQLY